MAWERMSLLLRPAASSRLNSCAADRRARHAPRGQAGFDAAGNLEAVGRDRFQGKFDRSANASLGWAWLAIDDTVPLGGDRGDECFPCRRDATRRQCESDEGTPFERHKSGTAAEDSLGVAPQRTCRLGGAGEGRIQSGRVGTGVYLPGRGGHDERPKVRTVACLIGADHERHACVPGGAGHCRQYS